MTAYYMTRDELESAVFPCCGKHPEVVGRLTSSTQSCLSRFWCTSCNRKGREAHRIEVTIEDWNTRIKEEKEPT